MVKKRNTKARTAHALVQTVRLTPASSVIVHTLCEQTGWSQTKAASCLLAVAELALTPDRAGVDTWAKYIGAAVSHWADQLKLQAHADASQRTLRHLANNLAKEV